MRQDLLKIIKDSRDITHVFVLTHNIDFLFIQAVLIPALRKCGSPTLTIFADAQCAEESYQSQFRFLKDLGLRYRVVPIAMQPGFRFHPKAVFLSGLKQATLLVGSGNLTFGGWRENGEVWFQYDATADGVGAVAGFRNYMRDVIDLCSGSKESLQAELEEAFDTTSRNWAESLEFEASILGHAGKGDSMLSRMKEVAGEKQTEHLLICTPYFDRDAEALKATVKGFGAQRSTVMVQDGYTNLQADAAVTLDDSVTLSSVKFEHRETNPTTGMVEVREARLHAKFYALQSGDEVIVFAGSANCSLAALTIPGAAGNAELMSWKTLSRPEFEATFLSELTIVKGPPILSTDLTENAPIEDARFIRILAARVNSGTVEALFKKSDEIQVTEVVIDGSLISASEQNENWIKVHTQLAQPRTITLVGTSDDEVLSSPLHWIDDESALRISARGRSLAESIGGLVRSESWGVGAWTDVLAELYKHLEYMPKSSVHGGFGKTSGAKKKGIGVFGWDDVFSSSYGLSLGSGFPDVPIGFDDRVGGLRSMLLRWYGIEIPDSDEKQDAGEDEPSGSGTKLGDDRTDKPEPLPRPPSPPLPAPTLKERKRALKLVGQVADRMANPQFLSERPPHLLGKDLKVASLLLRAGLSDDWLAPEEFFNATLKIWLPLFFSAQGGESTGWLEQRYMTDSNPEDFADAMRSVELAAALACWALSVVQVIASSAHALFVLASVLSVARLPWLWQAGGNKQIAKQVASALTCMSGSEDLPWNEIEGRWLTLIRRGYALNRLQVAISSLTVVKLSSLIKQDRVLSGELLWQGSHGFCIANSDCSRKTDEKCEVLLLQHGSTKRTFSASLLIPLAGLLDGDIVGEETLPSKARIEVRAMILELQAGLKHHS
jgi:hypothetical protein